MKKNVTFIGLILIFGLIAQMGMVVDSFPGFHGGSECSYCHNEPATSVYENLTTATIDLDGQWTEEYWVNYEGRRNMVPVVNRDMEVEHMFTEIIFSQNTTHLFVALEFDSFGVVNATADAFDGAAIIWNIDSTDMSFNMADGMQLRDGSADVWFWEANSADAGKNNTELIGTVKDYSLDDGGWDKSETADAMAGVMHNWRIVRNSVSISYTLEFARPLTTAETVADVQFEYSGFYQYQIAIWNNASGEDHHMGYPHEVYVQGAKGAMANPTETVTEEVTVTGAGETVTKNNTVTFTETKTEGPFPAIFVGVSLISTVVAIVYNRKRK
jgi:hypothetical protein